MTPVCIVFYRIKKNLEVVEERSYSQTFGKKDRVQGVGDTTKTDVGQERDHQYYRP